MLSSNLRVGFPANIPVIFSLFGLSFKLGRSKNKAKNASFLSSPDLIVEQISRWFPIRICSRGEIPLLFYCIAAYVATYKTMSELRPSIPAGSCLTSKTGQYGTTQQFIQYQTLLKMSWCWVYAVQLKEQDKLRC